MQTLIQIPIIGRIALTNARSIHSARDGPIKMGWGVSSRTRTLIQFQLIQKKKRTGSVVTRILCHLRRLVIVWKRNLKSSRCAPLWMAEHGQGLATLLQTPKIGRIALTNAISIHSARDGPMIVHGSVSSLTRTLRHVQLMQKKMGTGSVVTRILCHLRRLASV